MGWRRLGYWLDGGVVVMRFVVVVHVFIWLGGMYALTLEVSRVSVVVLVFLLGGYGVTYTLGKMSRFDFKIDIC